MAKLRAFMECRTLEPMTVAKMSFETFFVRRDMFQETLSAQKRFNLAAEAFINGHSRCPLAEWTKYLTHLDKLVFGNE